MMNNQLQRLNAEEIQLVSGGELVPDIFKSIGTWEADAEKLLGDEAKDLASGNIPGAITDAGKDLGLTF